MKAEEIEELAELAYPIIKDVYKELWNENQAYKKGYNQSQDTMQNDIDELVEFIKEVKYVTSDQMIYSKSIELIQKHTKK